MAATGSLAPNQRPLIARLGIRALIGTSFAGIYDLSWDSAGNRWWLVRVHD